MPVPVPGSKEKQDDFISRCMEWAAENEGDMAKEQQLAMCYSTFRINRGADITKAELFKELDVQKKYLMAVVVKAAEESSGEDPS